jgi:hypothetical protein
MKSISYDIRRGACPRFGQYISMDLYEVWRTPAIRGKPFLALLTAVCRADPAPVIHYAPTENLEHVDVALIDRAEQEIDMAAYVLTDWRHSPRVAAITRYGHADHGRPWHCPRGAHGQCQPITSIGF